MKNSTKRYYTEVKDNPTEWQKKTKINRIVRFQIIGKKNKELEQCQAMQMCFTKGFKIGSLFLRI